MDNIVKEKAIKEIDDKASLFCEVSDKIWEYAEISLKEFNSAALYCKVLKENGFTVTENISDISTCFKGSFGEGAPYIGILAEFDALSGLSQEGGASVKRELTKGGCGHGCGHNMLGAGSLGAAFGIKKYLQEKKCSGTVIFYGCPGEEGGAAKAFLASDSEWYKLDAALTWHPESVNRVMSGTCFSCVQKEYEFFGISSHAASEPENGRSALDAVELLNVGVQFLREHASTTSRIHYAITEAGGKSPNVVQNHARVLYMIRDIKGADAVKLAERVDKIAEGAALMTGTTMKINFIDGCSNTVPNEALESLLYESFKEIGAPTYTDEEKAFAKKIVETYEIPITGLPDHAVEGEDNYEFIKSASNNGEKALNDFLIPYKFNLKAEAGSTDVGDVSWQTPTAQINVVGFAAGAPGHSWQNVSVGKTSIAHKGVINAAKVLTVAAIKLFESPEILTKAKAEFSRRTKEGYVCPIPKGVKAVAIED